MKTKNIVITFLGDFNYDARCINMVNSLMKENYSITFIGVHEKILAHTKFSGVKFHKVSLKMSGIFRYIEFYLKTRRYIMNQKFDFAISGDLYSLAALCTLKNTQIIYDCREIYTELSALENKSFYKKITFIYENYFLKFVHKIITTASSDELMLKEKYSHHTHLQWSQIYNYPLTPNPDMNIVNIKNKFKICSDHTLIVYQGVIQKHRGIGQLIELIQASSTITAIIIGDGEEKNLYVSQAKKYGIANRVIFLGKVPYLDLLEYTAACDIGWLVIRGHGISNQLALPNKLFEYAIMGLPIISSSLKNMKDIINKYNLGFVVDDRDINDQLNAVEKINSGALQNNKKNVSKLSWDVQHNTFIGLISE